jgi:NADH-quinone oxidoreductase subunit J
MIETAFVYAFASLALVSAVAMLFLRHPMRVAIALITTMLSLGGIYGLLGVHVIAIFQVLIYVGAVMVFMVYVIMLLNTRDPSFTQRFSLWLLPGVVAAVVLVALVVSALWSAMPVFTGGGQTAFGLSTFSIAFLNEYWLHFELISVLLVAAVVAALAVLHLGKHRRG